ncbi:hypothetical protein MKX01_027741 [Papaver californicum]|nr:hypothetical protein MKX01_027741 [Papaver californicum]
MVSRDLKEKNKCFNVFRDNVEHLQNTNKLNKPYKLKLKKFADMTSHEYKSSYAGPRVKHYRMLHGPRRTTSFMYDNARYLLASIDWRKKGAVTSSCWAFSTIVGMEDINQIKTIKLVSLSEQELVDCDNTDNQGCNDYPYVEEDRTYDANKLTFHYILTIDGLEIVPAGDEEALRKAITYHPVLVVIDAEGIDFQLYSEIVKNSWGTEWDDKGYIRIKRGAHTKGGLCDIALEAYYPIKSSPNPTKARAWSSSSIKDEL